MEVTFTKPAAVIVLILSLLIGVFLVYSTIYVKDLTELVAYEKAYYNSAARLNQRALVNASRDAEYKQFANSKDRIGSAMSSLISLDNDIIDSILAQAGITQVDSTGRQIFPRPEDVIKQTTGPRITQ